MDIATLAAEHRELKAQVEALTSLVHHLQSMVMAKTKAADMLAAKYGLTPTEASILELLTDGALHSTSEIVRRCCRHAMANPKKTVDVHVHNLRKALEPHGIKIDRVWGKGPRLPEPHLTTIRNIISGGAT